MSIFHLCLAARIAGGLNLSTWYISQPNPATAFAITASCILTIRIIDAMRTMILSNDTIAIYYNRRWFPMSFISARKSRYRLQ
jgi:hypothetical protein